MESRLSVLEVTGRVNNRVDGFLNCGYCGGGFDVNWYQETCECTSRICSFCIIFVGALRGPTSGRSK